MLLVWWRYDVRRRAALERFLGARERAALMRSVSPARRWARRLLQLGALASLCAALAGPQWGYHWEQQTSRGNEIVFALDVSRSMLSADVRPNRLTRAKLAIDDFSRRLQGDAVGIVAFAGTAFLVNPITLDYGAFHASLDAIDTETIPHGGTNISSAIDAADIALHRRRGGEKTLILLSDGEDLEGDARAAATRAARDGIKIFTVGVGTPAGDLIPLSQAQGGGFVTDDAGMPVKSRLDEPALEAIAAATGGFYVPLGGQAEGLERIFTQALDPLSKHDLASRQQKIFIERFQWPLAPGVVLLLLSLVVGTRRGGLHRKAAAATVLALGLALAPRVALRAAGGPGAPDATAEPGTPTARGAPTGSAVATGSAVPKGPAVPTGRPAPTPAASLSGGAAAYRAGQFPQAARAFQESITRAPSESARRLAEQQDAYYNLGNTLYRTGQKTEQSSRETTLERWNEAVKAYDTALQLRPDDADSRYNREFVQHKIDALRQQDPPKNPAQGGGGKPPPPSGGGNPPVPPGGVPPRSSSPPPAGAPPEAMSRGVPPPAAPDTMSAEEARELLDSAKGEERNGLGAAPPPKAQAPEKPYRNW